LQFENIQKLEGHHGEVWALAVSHQGKFIVTGSHDKSIRVWEKLDDQLFLEEEREREMEALYDTGITDSMNRDEAIGSGAGDGVQAPEVTGVSKQTTETLMAGERIIEALDIADSERAAFAAWEADKATLSEEAAAKLPPPERNPTLKAYDVTPEKYVLTVVEKIQAAALLDALLVLPFGKVVSLMTYLDEWAKRVCIFFPIMMTCSNCGLSGVEHHACCSHPFLPSPDASSSDCREPSHASRTHSLAQAPAGCLATPKGHNRVQPRCTPVHSAAERRAADRTVLRGGDG
jgi:hypothetical protein